MENPTPEALSSSHPESAPVAGTPQGVSRTTKPAPGSANERASVAGDGRHAVILAAMYLIFYQITPRLPFSDMRAVAATTLLSLPLMLLFAVRAARAMRTPRALALGLCISGTLILPSVLIPLLLHLMPGWWGWRTLSPAIGLYGWGLYGLTPGLDGLLLIWFAASLGALIARMVREMKLLLPMAVALAVVDIWAVFGGGLVAQAQSGKAPVTAKAMQALTAKLPTITPKSGAAPLQLAIGFADFLFVALFFACFAKFGIPSRNTFLVLCGALVGYMIYVAVTGTALPALVPIAVVVICMNLRRFRYERSEVFALLYAGLIIVGLALVYLLRNGLK